MSRTGTADWLAFLVAVWTVRDDGAIDAVDCQ